MQENHAESNNKRTVSLTHKLRLINGVSWSMKFDANRTFMGAQERTNFALHDFFAPPTCDHHRLMISLDLRYTWDAFLLMATMATRVLTTATGHIANPGTCHITMCILMEVYNPKTKIKTWPAKREGRNKDWKQALKFCSKRESWRYSTIPNCLLFDILEIITCERICLKLI